MRTVLLDSSAMEACQKQKIVRLEFQAQRNCNTHLKPAGRPVSLPTFANLQSNSETKLRKVPSVVWGQRVEAGQMKNCSDVQICGKDSATSVIVAQIFVIRIVKTEIGIPLTTPGMFGGNLTIALLCNKKQANLDIVSWIRDATVRTSLTVSSLKRSDKALINVLCVARAPSNNTYNAIIC